MIHQFKARISNTELNHGKVKDTTKIAVVNLPVTACVSEKVLKWSESDLVVCNIDWITVTGKNLDSNRLATILEQFILGKYWGKGDEVEHTHYPINRQVIKGGGVYTDKWVNDKGISLEIQENKKDINSSNNSQDSLVTSDKSDYTYNIVLMFSGESLKYFFPKKNLINSVKLLDYLQRLGSNISRLDCAITDYNKKLNIFEVWGHAIAKNFTGAKKFQAIQSGDNIDGITGVTLSFGSRLSGTYTRIYDTYVKHGICAIRYETEFKKKKANKVASMLVDSMHGCSKNHCMDADSLLQTYINVALGQIRFIDRNEVGNNGNISHIKSLEFWEKWTQYISSGFKAIKIKVDERKTDLLKKFNWLSRQVKGTLAMLCKGLGRKEFNNLIEYLLKKDEEKNKTDSVLIEENYMVNQLIGKGVKAILSDEEIKQSIRQYGIEFSLESNYYTTLDYPSYNMENRKGKKYTINEVVYCAMGEVFLKCKIVALYEDKVDIEFLTGNGGFYRGLSQSKLRKYYVEKCVAS